MTDRIVTEADEPIASGAPLGGDPDGVTAAGYTSRARTGVRALLLRQVVVHLLTFSGGVVLARILAPEEFGVFAIASFLVNLFTLVGDLGVAASLVQRRQELRPLDLQVAFTIQLSVATAGFVAVSLAAGPLLRIFSGAPMDAIWLVRALGITLFLTSWRSMSVARLERHLRFRPLAVIEVIEALSFQAVAVAFALAGFRVWALVAAVLVRALLGAALIYVMAPWPVRLRFDRRVARNLLNFGAPFQLQTILNQIGGWFPALIGGTVIGPRGVGFLTWSSSNGRKPLVLAENVMRVAYPHLSRVQSSPEELLKALNGYLLVVLVPAAAWLALLAGAGPPIITAIYTDKWSPATVALALYAGSLLFDGFGWVLGVSLNAIGQVKQTAIIVGLRTVVLAALSVPFALLWGFTGMAAAYLVASAASVPWLVLRLGPGAYRSIVANLAWLFVPTVVAAFAGRMVTLAPGPAPLIALAASATTGVVFGAGVWVTGPQLIRRQAREWYSAFARRASALAGARA